MRVDAEKDFHGYTTAGMISWLNQQWASRRWDGLQRVRIIHGKGEVLIPALRRWCDEKGIPWAPEPGNPGTTILHPARRQMLRATTMRPSPITPIAPITRISRTPKLKPATPKPPTSRDSDLFEEELRRL